MLKTTDIHIRDPFVLPIMAEKKYCLYGTTGSETWTDSASGFDYYTSPDLQSWEGPFPAFRPSASFWADRNFWAPEVHFYRGRCCLFASFKAEGVCRGTQILAAESPQGPFQPISDGPVTPHDWECLDGTLFVDANDQPWMVFCHEWVQVGDGEVCALRLSDDLTSTIGQPHRLFRASEAPWAQEINSKGRIGYVTDGPSLHRLANGDLIMLWSSFSTGGYTVGVAKSTSGDILGPWQHVPDPVYAGHGGEFGHVVIDPDGSMCDCGNRGCLEAFVAEPWMLQRARLRGLDVSTPDDLLAAAKAGNAVALDVFAQGGRVLGQAVASVVNLLNPALIIISGEGVRAGDFLFVPMREAANHQLFGQLAEDVEIRIEPLSDDTWARGAASLVLGRIFSMPELESR